LRHLKTVWFHGIEAGDRGTWFGGIATAVAVIVTLIIAVFTAIQQRKQALELQKEKQALQRETQAAARRAHAEKFSCWVSGRINSPAGALPVQPGELVVALMNESQQPFMEAVVEVELKEAQGAASALRFKINAVPPGASWFAFDSSGKKPETHLLSIWFFDNGMRLWNRSSSGELTEIEGKDKETVRSDKSKGADHASLHHGEPAATLGLDDAWA
jgi:hypothetical protein